MSGLDLESLLTAMAKKLVQDACHKLVPDWEKHKGEAFNAESKTKGDKKQGLPKIEIKLSITMDDPDD